MSHLVIVGGGFAGVWAALAAARVRRGHHVPESDLRIYLVSRDPWLTIRPRLYEASLDAVRVPLDEVLDPVGVKLLLSEVTRVDVDAHRIVMGDQREVPCNRLVLAAGSRAVRPDIPGAEHAFSVDSYSEATALHRQIAETIDTAVVIGAGFTGIEVATSLISRARAVVLVERSPDIAPDLGPDAREHVRRALETLGIETRTSASVNAISENGVLLNTGEWIPSATVVWTGGFRANELGRQLGIERDEAGRIPVDAFLRVPGIEDVYVAGDMARAVADPRSDVPHVAPMSCQIAIPMGEVAGHNAAATLLGLPLREFSHPAYVTCLDLGDAGALFMEGWRREVRLSGFWGKRMKEMINTRLIYPPRAA